MVQQAFDLVKLDILKDEKKGVSEEGFEDLDLEADDDVKVKEAEFNALGVYDKVIGDSKRMKERLDDGWMKGIKFEVSELVRIEVVLFIYFKDFPYLQNYPLLISLLLYVFPEVQAFNVIRMIQQNELSTYLREKQSGSYASAEVGFLFEIVLISKVFLKIAMQLLEIIDPELFVICPSDILQLLFFQSRFSYFLLFVEVFLLFSSFASSIFWNAAFRGSY
jgi:hypothetical protein